MAEKSAGAVAEIFAAFLKLGLTSFGGRSRISVTSGRNSSSAGNGRAKAAMPISLRSASSCPVRHPARSALRSASCAATACSAGSRRGSPSPCRGDHSLCLRARGDGFHRPCCRRDFHGLKLVAVAVVAQAIWGMANSLTPDRERAGIALAAVAIVVFIGGSFGRSAPSRSGPWPGFGCAAETVPPRRAISALRYRLDTARSRWCCSPPCS